MKSVRFALDNLTEFLTVKEFMNHKMVKLEGGQINYTFTLITLSQNAPQKLKTTCANRIFIPNQISRKREIEHTKISCHSSDIF